MPRVAVVRLFADRSNDNRWRPGRKQVELVEGDPDKEGDRRRLTYRIGQDEIVMEEKPEELSMPDSITSVYTAYRSSRRVRSEAWTGVMDLLLDG